MDSVTTFKQHSLTWAYGSEVKDKVKERAMSNHHKFLLALERPGYKGYAFTTCPDVRSIPSSKKPLHVYEVLGSHRKLYVDIEWVAYKEDEPETPETLKLVVDQVIDTIIEALPHPVDRKDFCVATSTRAKSDGSTKHSYHINLTTHAFEFNALKGFIQGLADDFPARPSDKFPRTMAPVVDMAVYTSDRVWRLVGSAKVGTDAPFAIITPGHTFRDSVCSDTEALPVMELPNIDPKPRPAAARRSRSSNSTIRAVGLGPRCRRVNELIHPSYSTQAVSETPEGHVRCRNLGPRLCCLTGNTHESNNCYVYAKMGKLYLRCYSDKCRGKELCLGDDVEV